MKNLVSLLPPTVIAGLALWTGGLPFKLGVPGVCAFILVAFLWRSQSTRRLGIWKVVLAFGMSMVGDYFLASRSGQSHYFEAGIASFFIAHLGYLGYALTTGKLHRPALVILLAGFGLYFALFLSPAIDGRVLWGAVLLYLLVSCVGLSAAIGLVQPLSVKGPYVAGIGFLVFSDTLISFNEFLGYRDLNSWILPTYYFSLLAMTASILIRIDVRPGVRQD